MIERHYLEECLRSLPDVAIAPWKDSQLICVTFGGKEVGHFHGQDVLDLRLSPKIIREEGLSRAVSSEIHPDRTLNSRWIGVQFASRSDVDKVVRLVQRACEVR